MPTANVLLLSSTSENNFFLMLSLRLTKRLWSKKSLVSVLKESVDKHGHRVAIEYHCERAAQWRQQSYAELWNRIEMRASHLQASASNASNRVALMAPESKSWTESYFGCLRSGKAVVPIDSYECGPTKLAWLAEQTECNTLLVDAKTLQRIRSESERDSVDGLAPFANVLVIDDDDQFDQFDGAELDFDALDARCDEDEATVFFTSGTTKAPRGVPLTSLNQSSCVQMLREHVGTTLDCNDRFYSVLPFSHAFGWMGGLMLPLASGCCVVFVREFPPSSQTIVSTLGERRVSVLVTVPQVLQLIKRAIERKVDGRGATARRLFDATRDANAWLATRLGIDVGHTLFRSVHAALGTGHLKAVAVGGAALDPAVYEFFRGIGIESLPGYGCSETSPSISFSRLGRSNARSVGELLPGVEAELRDVDDSGNGHLYVRGPQVFGGYLNDPHETAAAFDEDGFYATGDIGHFDASSRLVLVSRASDMIVCQNGKKLWPDDVEAIYAGAFEDDQLRFTVVGVPTASNVNEQPAMVIEMPPAGAADSARARRRIRAGVSRIAAKLPAFQRIGSLHFVDEPLPITRLQKVKRKQVRQMLMANAGDYARVQASHLEQESALGADDEQAAVAAAAADVSVDGAIVGGVIACVRTFVESDASAPSIDANSDFEVDLHIDSLTRVELLLELERHFDVRLSSDVLPSMKSVRHAALHVQRARQAGHRRDAHSSSEALPPHAAIRRTVLEEMSAEQRAELVALADTPFTNAVRALGGRLMAATMRWLASLSVHGIEHLHAAARSSPSGSFVFAPNHSSHADTLAILTALFRDETLSAGNIRIMGGADYFFDRKWKGLIFRHIVGVLPFERQKNYLHSMTMAVAALVNKHPVLIFPEGTRSASGRIGAFMPGIGILSKAASVPIVPVYLHGCHEAYPKGAYLPRRSPISVYFCEPIEPDLFPTYKELSQEARRRIEAMRDSVV
jgi:long-chain acyl-CoA synthetase